MLAVSNLRSNNRREDVVAMVDTTLKRQERSICLGRREKDRGGGYGGYKREGIGKTTEKRGLKREEVREYIKWERGERGRERRE
ncbi:hypothetical protein ACFX1T_037635 [Malus domestica]